MGCNSAIFIEPDSASTQISFDMFNHTLIVRTGNFNMRKSPLPEDVGRCGDAA
ncbi:hypothetical protein EVA_14008 [gut metagenome]|uniref:Uncharacterized protein n=1 Tax=gut metagenome TaxID=749906 RepID=J9CD29_9ZZZZ